MKLCVLEGMFGDSVPGRAEKGREGVFALE